MRPQERYDFHYFETIPPLSREREVELSRIIGKAEKPEETEAYWTLVKANLPFVVNVAKSYLNNNKGMTLVELVSEGNEGLMEAAKRFGGERGNKFISYAVWWIRQKIDLALKNRDVVRRPASIYGTQGHIKRPVSKREQELGRFLNVYEISELVDLPPSRIQNMRAGLRGELSFDGPLDPSDDRNLYAVTPDASSSNLDQGIMEQERKEFVRRYLGQLDERDRIILEYRFGLRGDRPLNLEEIGGIIGVTKERIRQLETRARGKLKKMVTKELIMTQIDLG